MRESVRPEFKTITVGCVLGYSPLGIRAAGLMVMSSQGTCTFVFSSGSECQVDAGQALNTQGTDELMEIVGIKSTTALDSVTILYGDGHLSSLSNASTIAAQIKGPLADDGFSVAESDTQLVPATLVIAANGTADYQVLSKNAATFCFPSQAVPASGALNVGNGDTLITAISTPVYCLELSRWYPTGIIPAGDITQAIDNGYIFYLPTVPTAPVTLQGALHKSAIQFMNNTNAGLTINVGAGNSNFANLALVTPMQGGTLTSLTNPVPVFIGDGGGGNAQIANVDADQEINTRALATLAYQYAYTAPGWDRRRQPKIYNRKGFSGVGPNLIWTPAAGKKFRLLRYILELTENATQAAGGIITATLQDAATNLAFVHDIFVPAAAVGGVGQALHIDVDLGEVGFLSAVANNALNISLSAALTVGAFGIISMGIEE